MSRATPQAWARLVGQGYLGPGHGPCCRTCGRGRLVFEGEVKRVHCRVHKVRTACNGWCPKWTEKEAA